MKEVIISEYIGIWKKTYVFLETGNVVGMSYDINILSRIDTILNCMWERGVQAKKLIFSILYVFSYHSSFQKVVILCSTRATLDFMRFEKIKSY